MNYIDKMQEEIKNKYGKFPSVLVGAPVNIRKDYIIERYINRLKELTYPNYQILLADNSKSEEFKLKIESMGIQCIKTSWYEYSRPRICESRNAIRNYVLENKFDYYLSVEADVIPPRDIIEQLMIHDKDIVGGWYYISDPGKARPCLAPSWIIVDGSKAATPPPCGNEMAQKRLMKVFIGSMGITLFKREVLEKIRFKVSDKVDYHDDTWFYTEADILGYDVWVDTDLLVPHFQKSGQWLNEKI